MGLKAVQRDMHALGYGPRVRPVVPCVPSEERKKFARDMLAKPAYLKRLVFSDEHWVTCNDHSGRTQWCKKGEKPMPRVQKARRNVPAMQIWCAFGYNWRSHLVFLPRPEMIPKMTATRPVYITQPIPKHESPAAKLARVKAKKKAVVQRKKAHAKWQKLKAEDKKKRDALKKWTMNSARYLDMCITPKVLKDMKRLNLVYQQDGASCHTSNAVKAAFQKAGVEICPWFSHSPDMAPPENYWAYLDREVSKLAPRTYAELMAATKKVWEETPVEVMNNFQASFEGKCRKVAITG
jgi:hypothetical protein